MSPRLRYVLPSCYAATAFAVIAGGIWFIERPDLPVTRTTRSDVAEIGSLYAVRVPFYATPQRDDLQYVVVPDLVNEPDLAESMLAVGDAFELQIGEQFAISEVFITSDSITHVRIQTAHGPLWALGAIVLSRWRCVPLDRDSVEPTTVAMP